MNPTQKNNHIDVPRTADITEVDAAQLESATGGVLPIVPIVPIARWIYRKLFAPNRCG